MAEEEQKESAALKEISVPKQNYGANDTHKVPSNVAISLQPPTTHSASDDEESNILLNLQPHVKDNDLEEKLLSSDESDNTHVDSKDDDKPRSKFRFAHPSQLAISPHKYSKKLEKQAITQMFHGKCDTFNFVMDFQMDIGIVHPINIRMVNGVKSGKLSVSQRNEIKNEIWKIWMDCTYFQKIKCYMKCKYPLCCWCIIFSVFIITWGALTFFRVPGWYLFLFFFLFCGLIPCVVVWCHQWGYIFRAQFLKKMTRYMDQKLKERYPDLLFTLIYPIKMGDASRFKSVRNGLWCYLRISEGVIDLDDFEPLCYRTSNLKEENEEKLPEYNEHCRLHALAKDYGNSSEIKNVAKMGKYGVDAAKFAKSVTDLISSIQ